ERYRYHEEDAGGTGGEQGTRRDRRAVGAPGPAGGRVRDGRVRQDGRRPGDGGDVRHHRHRPVVPLRGGGPGDRGRHRGAGPAPLCAGRARAGLPDGGRGPHQPVRPRREPVATGLPAGGGRTCSLGPPAEDRGPGRQDRTL
ncbi:MAG: hypothetical protein AVDCRST_MAG02-1583, partial [uncultured Rubrobacteraceae bacterium]